MLVALRDALDCGDVAPLACPTSTVHDLPPAHRYARHRRRTGWVVTADMGTGQIQILAQEMDKEGPVLASAETALPFTVNLMVDTRDTSRCFVIIPIRGTGRDFATRISSRRSS